jgi:hypothetical protein
MKAMIQVRGLVLILVVLALAAVPTPAQQKDPRVNPPVAAIGTESTSKNPDAAATAGPAVTPDQQPLSGAFRLGLGSLAGGRSFLTPSLTTTQGFESGQTATGTDLFYRGTLNAKLQLQKLWAANQLSIDYGVGTQFNRGNGAGGFAADPVHNLGITFNTQVKRWAFTFSDNFSYLPESAFGAANTGRYGNVFQSSLGLSGFSLPGQLNSIFNPSQTILTAGGDRYSNSIVGQVQYNLSPRSSWTASSSYGILRYLAGGFIESNDISFQTGYNRSLTSRDTIALSYSFQQFEFGNTPGGAVAHSAQFSYARRLAGRFTVQLGGGPTFNRTENNLGVVTRETSVGINTSVLYSLPSTNFSLGYSRSTTNGSGVLFGAHTDNVQFQTSHQFTRKWTGNLHIGYAHNESLSGATVGPATSFIFNGWNGGVSISRPVGRSLRVSANYNAQYQNISGCVVACTSQPVRHVFSISLSWLFRQINLE